MCYCFRLNSDDQLFLCALPLGGPCADSAATSGYAGSPAPGAGVGSLQLPPGQSDAPPSCTGPACICSNFSCQVADGIVALDHGWV